VDGKVCIADAVYLVSYIYREDSPPCEPAVSTAAIMTEKRVEW